MIIHLSIFVFGVDSIKKSIYSDIGFTVDQDNLYNDEFKIVCDSFNTICNSNNDNMPEDILKYCAWAINNKIKPQESLNRDIDYYFHNLFNKTELNPNYLFISKLLKTMETNISDIYEAVRKRLYQFESESIDFCNTKMKYFVECHNVVTGIYLDQVVETSFDSKYDNYFGQINEIPNDKINEIYYKISRKCLKSISDISDSIDNFKFLHDDRNRERLIKIINDFIGEYHNKNHLTGIVLIIDDNTYNNYMLFLTILRLDEVLSNYPHNIISKNSCWGEDIRISKMKNLINKLSVETFLFWAQDDVLFIKKMGKYITASNIKFWNECQISSILPPQKILDTNYENFIQEIEFYINRNLECLRNLDSINQEVLNKHLEKSLKIKTSVSIVIMNKEDYGNKYDEYISFAEIVDTVIQQTSSALDAKKINNNNI